MCKSLAILFVGAMFTAVVFSATFDGVNVAELLKNESAVAGYVKCIMGTGECNESANRLKALVPNALLSKCSECTETQKTIVANIAAVMEKKYTTEWEKLLEKYDPKKEHRDEIAELIKTAKIPTSA